MENANRRIRAKLNNGALLGLDNGDPTDWDQYNCGIRRMFGGKLLAIAKTFGKAPEIELSLDTKDIPVRKIELWLMTMKLQRRSFLRTRPLKN